MPQKEATVCRLEVNCLLYSIKHLLNPCQPPTVSNLTYTTAFDSDLIAFLNQAYKHELKMSSVFKMYICNNRTAYKLATVHINNTVFNLEGHGSHGQCAVIQE